MADVPIVLDNGTGFVKVSISHTGNLPPYLGMLWMKEG